MEMKRIKLREFKNEMKKLKNFRLITISAIDSTGCYDLLYHFDINGVKTFKLIVSEKKPIIETISDIFPSADFYEREIHDFFGIKFRGNSRLHEKMFLPDDWKESPPLRKG